jgi:hypothetical protein
MVVKELHGMLSSGGSTSLAVAVSWVQGSCVCSVHCTALPSQEKPTDPVPSIILQYMLINWLSPHVSSCV